MWQSKTRVVVCILPPNKKGLSLDVFSAAALARHFASVKRVSIAPSSISRVRMIASLSRRGYLQLGNNPVITRGSVQFRSGLVYSRLSPCKKKRNVNFFPFFLFQFYFPIAVARTDWGRQERAVQTRQEDDDDDDPDNDDNDDGDNERLRARTWRAVRCRSNYEEHACRTKFTYARGISSAAEATSCRSLTDPASPQQKN